MFDFQRLDVYQKAKKNNKEIYQFLNGYHFDHIANDKLCCASFSIILDMAKILLN